MRSCRKMNRMCVPSWLLLLATGGALLLLTACHSPKDSQYYFSKAAAEDPLLEPLHSTPLYTVFYDHGLKRCVLHSAHTWGESGGGGGGTGVGVAVFSCDPIRVKNRSASMRARTKSGRPLDYPTPPKKKIKKPTSQPPRPLDPPPPAPAPAKPAPAKPAPPSQPVAPQPIIH
jgi:hypothetical protein